MALHRRIPPNLRPEEQWLHGHQWVPVQLADTPMAQPVTPARTRPRLSLGESPVQALSEGGPKSLSPVKPTLIPGRWGGQKRTGKLLCVGDLECVAPGVELSLSHGECLLWHAFPAVLDPAPLHLAFHRQVHDLT